MERKRPNFEVQEQDSCLIATALDTWLIMVPVPPVI